MYTPHALPYILLPLVIGIAATGARSQVLASEIEHIDALSNSLNKALVDIKELEEQVDELNKALASEKSNARGLQEQLEKLQAELNDARDLAFANIPIS